MENDEKINYFPIWKMIHLIRAHLRYRMIMGLHCITDEQIVHKEKYAAEYEKCFLLLHVRTYLDQKIAQKHPDYHWNFPKQHDVYHSSDDIRSKGAPTVYCTNNDQQVSAIDVTKEAMARIRMAVNAHDKEQEEELNEVAEHVGVSAESVRAAEQEPRPTTDEHWRFGALGKLEDSRFALRDASWLDEDTRCNLDKKLRAFLWNAVPDEALRPDSEERIDFDLLRCNPDFQTNHEKCFDCVNVNLTEDTLEFAYILCLFRCRFPSKREVDVALVRIFKKAAWKPKTMWENCRVLEDGRMMFMLPEFFIRGAHLINAFGSRKEDSTFYSNDVVDSDWFSTSRELMYNVPYIGQKEL
ncbi:hypothetical protein C8F01DRAFT_1093819 [Mycena amicta]|nr:hypothetical protein C8F01DRAFT_1093819 [Mycena amicta]